MKDRDTTKSAEEQGLFRKFDVRRLDGSDAPGSKHDGCEYFVLDMYHDPHALEAIRAYAKACAETQPQLSAELSKRFPARNENHADKTMPTDQQDEALRYAAAIRLFDIGGYVNRVLAKTADHLERQHAEIARLQGLLNTARRVAEVDAGVAMSMDESNMPRP